jgi:hypothetical protein
LTKLRDVHINKNVKIIKNKLLEIRINEPKHPNQYLIDWARQFYDYTNPEYYNNIWNNSKSWKQFEYLILHTSPKDRGQLIKILKSYFFMSNSELNHLLNKTKPSSQELEDLDEIRVNQPGKLKFPITVTKENRDQVLRQLKALNYKWIKGATNREQWNDNNSEIRYLIELTVDGFIYINEKGEIYSSRYGSSINEIKINEPKSSNQYILDYIWKLKNYDKIIDKSFWQHSYEGASWKQFEYNIKNTPPRDKEALKSLIKKYILLKPDNLKDLNLTEIHINELGRLEEADPQKGMKTMFGKKYPNCVKNNIFIINQ